MSQLQEHELLQEPFYTDTLYSSDSQSKCSSDRLLNFATAIMDDYRPPLKRIKTVRDPVSHRIIEKRRRDRMNNCLAELSNLLPARYLNKGQGRIEKTEIIELATRHIKHLNSLVGNSSKSCSEECCRQNFYMGFKECGAEVMRFLVEGLGTNPQDNLCVQLRQHLDKQSDIFCPSSENTDDLEPECQIKVPEEAMACASDSGFSESTMLQTTLLDKSQDLRLRSLLTEMPLEESHSRWSTCHQGQYLECPSTAGESESESHAMMSVMSDDIHSKGKEIYKFKNNIKLRFSADMSSQSQEHISSGQSDSSFTPYRQDSDRPSTSKSPSPSTESVSTAYPSSDYSSSRSDQSMKPGLSRAEEERKYPQYESQSGSSSSAEQLPGEPMVPAFALHPSATHYIPVAIPSSSLCSLLDGQSFSSYDLFHPISIPVKFGSPSTYLKNINVAFKRC